MTVEELLWPRFKVTDIWPGMELEPFHLNQIVTLKPNPNKEKDGDGFEFIHISLKHMPLSYLGIGFFTKYKNLFQPLQWWEERRLEDMPEYLNSPSRGMRGMFFKVESWHKSYFIIDGRQKMQYRNYIPATKEEYESYINKISEGK